ncbi:hypothetical protein QAC21B_03486 [Acinetobacter bohemicus]|nr:hypothetical protein QAC21B_03486 [Acinetobacter bohemicus]
MLKNDNFYDYSFFYILNRIDQNSSCKLCNSYYSVIKGLNVFLVGSN